MPSPTAADIIHALDLKPHPEGGHYRETFRDPRVIDGRAASTSIYFLLKRGERSHWHRIDAVEIWHYYAGAPLKLEVVDGAKEEIVRLGADIHAGEVPQVHGAGARLAGGGILRRLDAGRLHGRARLCLRRFRAGAGRLEPAVTSVMAPVCKLQCSRRTVHRTRIG